jgi:hypothetical protein
VTEYSTPVGSAKVVSVPFPVGLIRLQRIRPLDRFISSSVPELRRQQALPLDRGADRFGSALFHSLFHSREPCRQGRERSRAPTQHPLSKRGSLASSTFAPHFSLINRFSKCLFLICSVDLGPTGIYVALFSLADHLATLGPQPAGDAWQRHLGVVRQLLTSYIRERDSILPPRLISPEELMRRLNLEPGPIVCQLLDLISEAQAEGKIHSKEEAVWFAEEHLNV